MSKDNLEQEFQEMLQAFVANKKGFFMMLSTECKDKMQDVAIQVFSRKISIDEGQKLIVDWLRIEKDAGHTHLAKYKNVGSDAKTS